jgi:hypothetical protein
MNVMATTFERHETLAASIARLNRADGEYFAQRAADASTLAAYALDTRAPVETTARLQRAAAFFAGEARRSLNQLLESNQ